MSGNKVVKSVSFNLMVAEEAEALKKIRRKNFSGYVKGLILADLNKGGGVPAPVQVAKEETAAERIDRIRQQARQSRPLMPTRN